MLYCRSTRDGHQSKKEDLLLDTLLESVNCAPKMFGYHLIIYTFMDPTSVLVCELYSKESHGGHYKEYGALEALTARILKRYKSGG